MSPITDTIRILSTNSNTPGTTTITTTTDMNIRSATLLQSTSSSSLMTSSPTQIQSINNTHHITNTPSQPSNTLPPLTLPVTSPTPSISDGTVSPPPPPPIVSIISSTSVTDSSTSNPSVTLSTEGTLQSSTDSNTLAAVLSTVFISLVVTVLVILIVSVLVYKRRHQKLSSRGNSPMDSHSTEKETELNNMSNPTYQPQGITMHYSFYYYIHVDSLVI